MFRLLLRSHRAPALLVVGVVAACSRSSTTTPAAPVGPELVLLADRSTAATGEGVVVTSFVRNGDYTISSGAVVDLGVSGGGAVTNLTRDVYGVTTATLGAQSAGLETVSARWTSGASGSSTRSTDVTFAAPGAWSAANTGITLGYQANAAVIDPFDPDRVDLVGGATYETLNGGATWSVLAPVGGSTAPSSLSIAVLVGGMAYDPHHPGTIYAPFAPDPTTSCWARSIDDGATWVTSPCQPATGGLAFDPNVADVMYTTLTNDGGTASTLLRSNDGGQTWTSLAASLPGYSVIGVAPGASNVIYAAGLGAAVSTDGGLTFATSPGVPAALAGNDIVAVADASTAFIAPGAGGVWKTSDGGATWSHVVPAPTGVSDNLPVFALDSVNPSIAFAYDEDTFSLLRTADGGSTWSVAQANLPDVGAIAVDPQHDEFVYVASPQAVLKSSDHGVTWSAAPQGLPIQGGSLAIAAGAPSLLASFPSGLFRSTDGASSWSAVGALPAQFWGGVTVRLAQGGILVAAQAGEFLSTPALTIARSTDDGATWATNAVPARIDMLAAAPDDPALVYSSQYPESSVAVVAMRSEDGGATWTTLSLPAPTGQDLTPNTNFFPGPSGTLYLVRGGDDDVGYVSHDRGATWAPTGLDNVLVFVPDASDPNLAWALGSFAPSYDPLTTLLRTTDGGATWTQVGGAASPAADAGSPPDAGAEEGGAQEEAGDGDASGGGLPLAFWSQLLVAPDDPKTLFAVGDGPTTSLMVSHDAGLTWAALPSPPANDTFAIVSSTTLLGAGSGGISMTTTGGQ